MVVKHTNPCGIASRTDLKEAYRLAVRADPISAFGGIVAFNRRASYPPPPPSMIRTVMYAALRKSSPSKFVFKAFLSEAHSLTPVVPPCCGVQPKTLVYRRLYIHIKRRLPIESLKYESEPCLKSGSVSSVQGG